MSTDVSQEELEAGRGYEALFVPALFAGWVDHLVDGAGIEAGARVLDVACGTGVLARAALARCGQTGRVVGLDPAPGMIAAAGEIEPRIDWVAGRAEALPFDDGAFEHVVSQFGMMFFEDRLKAAREMHRVTTPGGTLALALWHGIDQNPTYGEVASVVEAHVSPQAGDAIRIPFGLGDPDHLADLLSQAGFEAISFETKTEQARFPSTRTLVEAELRGWLPLFDINLSEAEITDVLENAGPRLSKYASSSGEAVFPTSAYVMTARKPV